MIVNYIFNTTLSTVAAASVLFDEEHIPEIRFASLTDWGWVIFFSVVTLIVWLLIIFQVNSKGSHPYGNVSGLDNTIEHKDH